MTTENFAPVLQQLAAREDIDVTDLYIERTVVFKRKDGVMVGTVCQIGTPSSTKNKEGKRDPEMHQTEKGNQWHFGMKAHIGVDADRGWYTPSWGLRLTSTT